MLINTTNKVQPFYSALMRLAQTESVSSVFILSSVSQRLLVLTVVDTNTMSSLDSTVLSEILVLACFLFVV